MATWCGSLSRPGREGLSSGSRPFALRLAMRAHGYAAPRCSASTSPPSRRRPPTSSPGPPRRPLSRHDPGPDAGEFGVAAQLGAGQKAAANRTVIAVTRQRLAAGEAVARMYQEPGLAWLERQAEAAEDLLAESAGPSPSARCSGPSVRLPAARLTHRRGCCRAGQAASNTRWTAAP